MPRFVLLTRPDGRPVYVNAERVTCVGVEGGRTTIVFDGGDKGDVSVTETSEEVVRRLEEAFPAR